MKIGIITHHYINNFGAFLQGYALQEGLKKTFPNDEIYIINCLNVKHFIINTLGWFRFYPQKETAKSWLSKIKLPKTFSSERKKHLNMTRLCFNASQINAMNFDCIVVGSDEVWNYEDKKSIAKVKFAEGLSCKNIIAYAPSVGKANINDNVPQYVIDGIKKFKGFSTRDELTEKLIHKITGEKAVRVLDPTFLHDMPRTENRYNTKPYILFYYCDNLPSKYFNIIKNYAHEQGMLLYGAGECNKEYDDITVNLTPFEWVQMFRDAHFVFTGTFHGTVFSILNRKQFGCYLTNASRIKKVGSLLDDMSICNRDITKTFDINSITSDIIDYDIVYEKINHKRAESFGFLNDTINSL